MSEETYPNCRFYVEIDAIPQGVFTNVDGLQMETDVMNYEEGGNNGVIHRLPGRTKYGNLILKRGMTDSNDFLKWYLEVARGEITRCSVSVMMYDTAGNELVRWNFNNAYPVKWVGPQFSADGQTMAIETLELAHGGLELG